MRAVVQLPRSRELIQLARDAVVFRQDGAPSSPQNNDLWYQPSTKILYRWNGGGWDSLGGAVSRLDIITGAHIDDLAVGTLKIADAAVSQTYYAVNEGPVVYHPAVSDGEGGTEPAYFDNVFVDGGGFGSGPTPRIIALNFHLNHTSDVIVFLRVSHAYSSQVAYQMWTYISGAEVDYIGAGAIENNPVSIGARRLPPGDHYVDAIWVPAGPQLQANKVRLVVFAVQR